MSDEEPQHFKPGPEDFSFTFKDIAKGYANAELLLKSKARIREAMECYGEICENPAASQRFMPENTMEQLKTNLSRLRLAARFWQKDPKNTDFQRDYAKIAQMAYVDAADPLPVLDEVATVLKRHIEELSDPDSTMGAVTGLHIDELRRAHRTIERLQLYLHDFAEKMRKIATIGNVGIGADTDSPFAKRFLGRPIKPINNPNFEAEANFFAISGVLHSEKDVILREIDAMQPPEEVESLRTAFVNMAQRVADYATFAIDDPERAVLMIQPEIPACLKLLKILKDKSNSDGFDTTDILIGCLEGLRPQGRGKGASDS